MNDIQLTPSADPRFQYEESLAVVRWLRDDSDIVIARRRAPKYNTRMVQDKRDDSPLARLREKVKKTSLRAVARKLGVDHKTISAWIKRGNIPEKYLKEGVVVGKKAS